MLTPVFLAESSAQCQIDLEKLPKLLFKGVAKRKTGDFRDE